MNEIISSYKYLIDYYGGLKNCEVGKIILRINRTPQRKVNWAYPIEVTKEILSEIGEN